MSTPLTVARLRLERVPARIDQRPNGCWAACIAMLTGIPHEELDQRLPADADDAWFDAHGTDMHNDMVRRLRLRGWRLECTWRDVPRGFAIASGRSPRGTTVQHAVVVHDGELWHDPHPSRSGLLYVESFEIAVPFLDTLPEDTAARPSLVERPHASWCATTAGGTCSCRPTR